MDRAPARTRTAKKAATKHKVSLRVAGLFAGIGGLELGLHEAGHETEALCEIDRGARSVLARRFPDVALHCDIRELERLPKVDLIAAGFPCQDLSQAGRTAGIKGRNSGLVGEVFRLVEKARSDFRWLLLENVPFMLQLDRGRAMSYLTQTLSALGFNWAYRTIDTRCFGLPQRRQRVLLLASRSEDPRTVLFSDDEGPANAATTREVACGFYWTEGNKGLGWAEDAVPTLKGGSTIGIPSPPAIWMRQAGGEIVTPSIRDAERLQGFEADWTCPAVEDAGLREGARWKLVGNAVSVPVAEWLGQQLASPGVYDGVADSIIESGSPWPHAAWGTKNAVHRAEVSMWPVRRPYQHLAEFFRYPLKPLSPRATAGFQLRAQRSKLRFAEGFLDALRLHLKATAIQRV